MSIEHQLPVCSVDSRHCPFRKFLMIKATSTCLPSQQISFNPLISNSTVVHVHYSSSLSPLLLCDFSGQSGNTIASDMTFSSWSDLLTTLPLSVVPHLTLFMPSCTVITPRKCLRFSAILEVSLCSASVSPARQVTTVYGRLIYMFFSTFGNINFDSRKVTFLLEC